jgi:hypothetical protein
MAYSLWPIAYGLWSIESFAEGIDAFGQSFVFGVKAFLLLLADIGSVEG